MLNAALDRVESGVTDLVERLRTAEERGRRHGVWIPLLIQDPPSPTEMIEALRPTDGSSEYERMSIGISRVLALRAAEIRAMLLLGETRSEVAKGAPPGDPTDTSDAHPSRDAA